MKHILTATFIASFVLLGACSNLNEDTINRNGVISGLKLTPDERNIWDTLTTAQQDRAIAFIQNGGTLIASLGDK